MKKVILSIALIFALSQSAEAWSGSNSYVSFGFGSSPRYDYGYYQPYPVYYAPQPVYYRPAPIYVGYNYYNRPYYRNWNGWDHNRGHGNWHGGGHHGHHGREWR